MNGNNEADLTALYNVLAKAGRLLAPDGIRMKALVQGAELIRDKALSLLGQTEGGRRILASNGGAVRLRRDRKGGAVKVSATQKDDWRMPWMANGTGARDTRGAGPVIRKPAHRGMMQRPKGRFVERAAETETAAAIAAVEKAIDDFMDS